MRNSRALRELGLRHLLNLLYLYGMKGSGLFQKFVQVRPVMASIKVTEACNSKCITCNGLLLSKRAKELEGITDLSVSLDGLQTANDAIRGVQGGYRRPWRAFRSAKRNIPAWSWRSPRPCSAGISGMSKA